jgi:ABC-2 type transport system ATP-binding protein
MSTTLIEAQGLTKRYGDFAAVDNVSLSLRAGEIVGFLGPNGAGKTTTIKMLTGLMPADEGTVLVNGHDLKTEPIAAKSSFALVPDTPNLYGKLKAIEYLRFMGQLYRVPPDVAEQRIEQMLSLFELEGRAGDYLDSFSHGMQQKVAISGAFVHDPSIVFMDEPTVGLDPRSARLVKDLMISRRQNGRSVFFSTHILEIAQAMCDRVIIINRGQIVADAPVGELRAVQGGDMSLEDVFLELTGGREVDDIVKELADAG